MKIDARPGHITEVEPKLERYQFEVETIPAPKPVGPWKSTAPGVVKYKAYKEIIQFRANAVFPRPLSGPVGLCCLFTLPIPVSWSAATIRAAMRGEVPHTSKPDLKNLVAGVEDALNRIAWHDDAAVVCYGAPMGKIYGKEPGTSIVIVRFNSYGYRFVYGSRGEWDRA